MTKYAAFLRGINVGGHKVIKMAELQLLLEAQGLKGVRTFIQSGNFWFEDPATDADQLAAKIERGLQKALGYEVRAAVRSLPRLQALVAANPFRKAKPKADEKPYVTFLVAAPPKKPGLPLASSAKDVEVVWFKGLDAFSVSRPKNGRYGFPNLFIEKALGVPATTRNLNTLEKMAGGAP